MNTMQRSFQSGLWMLLSISLIAVGCASPTPKPVAPTITPTVTPEHMECTILPYSSNASDTLDAFIDDLAHVAGPSAAPVTLLVMTDFQCPGCAVLADAIDLVRALHPDEVRLIVRYFPDARFDKSQMAIQAAEAASRQGKFWEMYTLLFQRQPEWYSLSLEDFKTWLLEQTPSLHIDESTFASDMESEAVLSIAQRAADLASSTAFLPPLLYINNTSPYTGMADTSSLDQIVRLAILEAHKYHTCPPWLIDPAHQYVATLSTDRGDVILQLYPERAPLAVNNFVFLSRSGWYDGITFHQVNSGFVIQSGDPSGTGYGNPGYYFPSEVAPGLTFDHPGMLAMANAGTDTNGSIFFITFAPVSHLNGQFTIFGEVLTGSEVLASIIEGERLISVKVDER